MSTDLISSHCKGSLDKSSYRLFVNSAVTRFVVAPERGTVPEAPPTPSADVGSLSSMGPDMILEMLVPEE